jgi:hypothetical protein
MRTRNRESVELLAFASILAIAAGCGGGRGDAVGRLRASLNATAAPADVSAVLVAVVGATQSCDAPPIASVTLALAASAAADGGVAGRSVETVFLLSPGSYRVCATPMDANGQPSGVCARAEAAVDVMAGMTSEVSVVSQCATTPNGGIDTTITFNEPPQITGLTLPPPGAVVACQPISLTATARDPNGDAISFAWTIAGGPAGARIDGTGAAVQLVVAQPGEYQVRVTVTDPFEATAALVFPIDVAGGTCDGGAAGAGGRGGTGVPDGGTGGAPDGGAGAAGSGGAGGTAGAGGANVGPDGCPIRSEFDVSLLAGGMVAGPDHNMWFTASDSIIRMTPAGTITSFPAVGANLWRLVAGLGKLWSYEQPDVTSNTTAIGQITADGVITRLEVPGYVMGIAPAPDGDLWYTLLNSSLLSSITPSGEISGFATGNGLTELLFANGGLWGTVHNGIVYRAWTNNQLSPLTVLFPTSTDVQSMSAGPDGTVWYTTTRPPAGPHASMMLGRISPAGAQNEFFLGASSASQPAGAPDNSAWLTFTSALSGVDFLAHVTPDGHMAAMCMLQVPRGEIALGPDQRMWLTEPSLKRIATFAP